MHPHEHDLIAQGFARLYRGRLIPIIRGADQRALFPEPPRDAEGKLDASGFAAMSPEDLEAFVSASLEAVAKIKAKDPEFLADLTQAEVVEILRAGVEATLAAKAEVAAREQQSASFDADLAALSAQVEPPADPALAASDPDPDPDPEPDPDPDPDDPAITAATEPQVFKRPLPAAGRHQPLTQRTEGEVGLTLRASANVDGFAPGSVLDPRDGARSLNEALVRAIRQEVAGPPGWSFKSTIASADISGQVPEHRRLRLEQDMRNEEKILTLTAAAKANGIGMPDGMAIGDAEALTAAGGICAPVTPYYQLAFISEMQRPVRDSLVGFVADRGGINFAPPPYLAQITTGVGVITAPQDAAGGTAGTKTCQQLICPSFQVVEVESIFHCFEGGNLGQRAFPEQASQFSSLILAQHARVADTQLLNQIKAGSTNALGQSSVLGAISSLLNDMLTAAAAYRSNNRMAYDAPLQAIMPGWVRDVLLIDLIQSQFQRFSMDQAGLAALFAAFNLRVTFTLDGPTDGEGQVLARQAGSLGPSAPGSLSGTFPTVVEWALFHPGAWLFVDSGVLELGIVRDSSLNAINAYQVFGESWEAAAGIGVQSLWVTSNICATGATALAIANTHQCGS